jgi:hypothetical protein
VVTGDIVAKRRVLSATCRAARHNGAQNIAKLSLARLVEESKLDSSKEKASVKMSREMQGEEKSEKAATEIRPDDSARTSQISRECDTKEMRVKMSVQSIGDLQTMIYDGAISLA